MTRQRHKRRAAFDRVSVTPLHELTSSRAAAVLLWKRIERGEHTLVEKIRPVQPARSADYCTECADSSVSSSASLAKQVPAIITLGCNRRLCVEGLLLL